MVNNQLSLRIPMVVSERLRVRGVSRSELKLNLSMNSELMIELTHLNLFVESTSMAAKIERLQKDFLWSGVGKGKRDHLVSWDVVCKPRAKWGLGFGKISLRNLAILGK